MANSIKQYLGIFSSKERGRYFINNWNYNRENEAEIFKSYTLNEFSLYLSSLFESEVMPGDELAILNTFIQSIQKTSLKYFHYLTNKITHRRTTLYLMKNFFHLLKINLKYIQPDSAILKNEYSSLFSSVIYSKDKREDIFRIFDHYQNALIQKRLIDLADRKKSFLKNINQTKKMIQKHQKIFIDEMNLPTNYFETEITATPSLRFYTSYPEEILYKMISEFSDSPQIWWQHEIPEKENIKHQILYYDKTAEEIERAAEFIRYLLRDKKIDPEKILLVSHSLKNFSTIESIFFRYGIEIFLSKGKKIYEIPIYEKIRPLLEEYLKSNKNNQSIRYILKKLADYHNNYQRQLENSSNSFIYYATIENMEAINKIATILSDVVNREIFLPFEWIDDFIKESTITLKKSGILVQELNQTPGIQYEYVILTGIENLFPEPGENIFYLPSHASRFFYQNDSFLLSRFYLHNLKSSTQSLTVLLPKESSQAGFFNAVWEILFSNKKFKPVSDEIKTNIFHSDKIFTKENPQNRSRLDEKRELYLKNMVQPHFTSLDGLLDKNLFSSLNNRFSSSYYAAYRRCPRAFLYEHLMNLKKNAPLDEANAMNRGSIIHSVFESFMQKLHEDSIHNQWEEDYQYLKELEELTQKKILEFVQSKNLITSKNTLPLSYQLFEKILLKNLYRDNEDWRKGLNILRNFYQREKAFGMGKDFYVAEKHLNQFANNHPFEIILDEDLKITITGIIDRIDCHDTENGIEIEIFDYKPMSKMLPSELKEKWIQDKDFQLIFYTMALQSAVNKNLLNCINANTKVIQITASLLSYSPKNEKYLDNDNPFRFMKVKYDPKKNLFIGYPGKFRNKIFECEKPYSQVIQSLKKVIMNIQNGIFPFTTEDKYCSYCDFQLLCKREKRKEYAFDVFEKMKKTGNVEDNCVSK